MTRFPVRPSACPDRLLQRLVVLAAILALVQCGIPATAADFPGVSLQEHDEPQQPQHEAPVEDAEEEPETKKESEGGSRIFTASATAPTVEVGGGTYLSLGRHALQTPLDRRGILAIRGPPGR